VSKISQLNASVREKLTELDIIDKTRDAYRGIPHFEENLKSLANRLIVDVEIVLTYVVKYSRSRLDKELSPETYEEKDLLTEIEQAKAQTENKVTPKTENTGVREDSIKTMPIKNRNQVGSPFKLRPPLQKSLTKDPNLDRRLENRLYPQFGIDSNPELIPKSISIKPIEKYKPIPPTPEKLEKNINDVFQTATYQRKEVQVSDLPQSNTFQGPKKLKPSRSNKSIASIEDLTSIITDSKVDPKTTKTSYSDAWKNYDILRIENKPLAVSQKNRKNLMEKVYNELVAYNGDIKKTINRYRLEYVSFSEKKKSRQKSFIIHETSLTTQTRSHLSTPTTSQSTHSQKPSVNQRNTFPNQTIYSNMKSKIEIYGGGKFSTLDHTNSPSLTLGHSQKNKAKVLVLPKLNIFEENGGLYSTTQSLGTPIQDTAHSKNKFFLGNDMKGKFDKSEANSPGNFPSKNHNENHGFAQAVEQHPHMYTKDPINRISPNLKESIQESIREVTPILKNSRAFASPNKLQEVGPLHNSKHKFQLSGDKIKLDEILDKRAKAHLEVLEYYPKVGNTINRTSPIKT